MTQSLSESGNNPEASQAEKPAEVKATPAQEIPAAERAKDLLMGKPMTAAELARGMASGGDIEHPDRGTGSAQDSRSVLPKNRPSGD